MANFPGVFAPVGFPTRYDLVTADIDVLAQNQNNLQGSMSYGGAAGARVANAPVDVTHATRAGAMTAGIVEFMYNRIHLMPAFLNLGNVVSSQTRPVTVWNSYFAPRTLEEIAQEGTEGIVLSGQPTPPLVFGALQARTWDVQISPDGPPVVSATYAWNFTGEPAAYLPITGQRISIWSFSPTWENGILERLEWMTDILPSPYGVEQRRALRLSPRRSFQLKLIANKRERSFMELACFDWGARNWAIPIWPDVQGLPSDCSIGAVFIPCVTEGRDFRVGGLAVIRGKLAFDFETVEVAEVLAGGITIERPLANDWPQGTRLYPVRTARFTQQPQLTRLTDEAITASAEFILAEPSDWPAIMPSTLYRGDPVFSDRPEESEDLTSTYQRLLDVVDNRTSFPITVDKAGLGFTAQAHRWLMYGRAEQSKMRSFLYALSGQLKAVWVPTHYADLVVVADILASSTSIDVEWVGYSRYGRMQPGRRDIMITLRNGTVIYRRILDASEVDGNTERISVDSSFTSLIKKEDVLRISYMARCRLDQDFIEINHQTDSDGTASAKGVWRSLRDDL